MSKLINLATSAALLTASSANAAHESPWIFPHYGNGIATTDNFDGVKGRSGTVTAHQPESWINNNEFPRGNGLPVSAENRIFAQPQSWIQG
ncbi:MAG: hypothetical protein ACREV9_16545 [Burkholderiales bacterium]